jgi:alkylated DNA nucleotide flippase Atl1
MKALSYFTQTVRKLAKEIPAGHVTTYGILARAAGGGVQAARSVSSVLARDPDWELIPFHRIVFSSGTVWKSKHYDDVRAELYRKEEIKINEKGRIENFRDVLYTFGMDI